jgi:threonine/homoserine/homoserine lactone efflux protein
VLGIHTGSLVHVAAAALGLSAVLVRSATAYATVKYAGAAYLVWLGIATLRRRDDEIDTTEARRPQSLTSIYVQGVVVNVLNPKTALFFFAFLPQFVDPSRGPVAAQATLFGLLFIVLGMLSDGAYALVSAAVGARLRKHARRMRIASGLIYLGLGLTAVGAKEQLGSASKP